MIARTPALARGLVLALAAFAATLAGVPASAQGTRQVDGDLVPNSAVPAPSSPDTTTAPRGWGNASTAAPETSPQAPFPAAPAQGATYHEDDLIGAAEGVFGKGAHGLADVIRDILHKQGQPVGYITGREAGGAFVAGLRYGSGTLYHKVEGQHPVYWTGPSLGFDFGGNAGNTFVLVYNLYNTDDLYRRYAAAEGQAYFIGGFHVSYLRRDNVVLIPVRLGVGLRLGVNAGYMKFSRKQNWQPF
jgi:hypothetical protein